MAPAVSLKISTRRKVGLGVRIRPPCACLPIKSINKMERKKEEEGLGHTRLLPPAVENAQNWLMFGVLSPTNHQKVSETAMSLLKEKNSPHLLWPF